MRSKADRERDIHAAVRTSTAQQAVRMLLSEVKQHGVQQVFNALDADNSGSITASEFRFALRKLGIGLVNKHVDALINVWTRASMGFACCVRASHMAFRLPGHGRGPRRCHQPPGVRSLRREKRPGRQADRAPSTAPWSSPRGSRA